MKVGLKSVVLAVSLLSMGAAHATPSSSFSSRINADTPTTLDVSWTWKWASADTTAESSSLDLTNWSAEAIGWRSAGSRPKYYLDVSAGPGATFSFEYESGIMTSSPNKYLSHSSTIVNGHTYTLDIAPSVKSGNNELTAHLVAVVPEPESYAMFLSGLGLVGVITTRRRRRA